MGIHVEYQQVAVCDVCQACETEAWVSQKEFIRNKRKEGWTIGKVVRCPKCKRIQKNEG